LVEFGKFPQPKVESLYMASNFDSVLPARPKGFIGQKEFFLCVSRWQPFKNVEKLVEAYGLALLSRSDLPDLILVGKPVRGYLGPTILIRELGLADKVQVYSDTSDSELAYLYENALINISPSLHEGFGLSVLEGLKRGCPSLDHKFTSTSEISDAAGIHIDMKNVLEISNALIDIALDDSGLEILRTKARARAGDFTWSATVNKLVTIYNQDSGK
jgi:glycosyltransferase involved in cell wall biosynthesis